MLKTFDFHSFIQRPHFSKIAKNLFRASFFTPADIAPYIRVEMRCFSLFDSIVRDILTDKLTWMDHLMDEHGLS